MKELGPNALGTQKKKTRVPESRTRAMLGRARGHEAQRGPLLEQQQKETGKQKGSGMWTNGS